MSKKLFLVLLLLSSMLFAGDKQSSTGAVGSDSKDLKVSKPAKLISQCDRLAGSPLDPELEGVPYKRIRVLQALKACKQEIKKDPKNPRTIFELGRVYDRAGEMTLANKYYKKACDKGYPIACYSLGISYRNGEGVKKDIEKTLQYFKSSCQKGVSPACNSIGYIYEQKKRYETAAKYYKKACLLENGMGCSNLGALHFRKRIHSANDEEAVKMFKLGCVYGNKKSCAYLKQSKIVSDIQALKNDIAKLKKSILTPPKSKPSQTTHVSHVAPRSTSRNVSIDIKYCSSNYNGSSCTVYINGSPKESISYKYEGGYTSQYNIYYKSGGGIYYTNDNKLYTPRCNKKYNVGGIGTAMYYMVKCYETGHY